MPIIKGFSKLSRSQKTAWLREQLALSEDFESTLAEFRHPARQATFDEFSENTLTNYLLPFGVAPNFLINDQLYVVPMVIEESSVVAAASRAASFWAQNGGFQTQVNDLKKTGHLWFEWDGAAEQLLPLEEQLMAFLREALKDLTASMEARGGGLQHLQILPQEELPGVYQLLLEFYTGDSMGANFINSCLEAAKEPLNRFLEQKGLPAAQPLMAILSNHTPDCTVTCKVSCKVEDLAPYAGGLPAGDFARKFKLAVDVARQNTHRAVTHNKGIYNGIDAVVLATGNDFRAVEAAGHAFAARDGRYRSLSECEVADGRFSFWLTVPLALGTVGGLTRLHPMAQKAMELLGQPKAAELMQVAAAVGLANNFGAVASLVTTGIQKGHMKLHLSNMLTALGASEAEKEAARAWFSDKTVSQQALRDFLESRRK